MAKGQKTLEQSTPVMVVKRFGLITKKSRGRKKVEMTEASRLYTLLINDIYGPINCHLKEQL